MLRTQPVYFNGFDGDRGTYARPPRNVEELAELLPEVSQHAVPRRLRFGRSAEHLNESGWAVVYPRRRKEARLRDLAPLLARRRRQAGALFRELDYLPGETALGFLERHGAGPGPVVPEDVPYFLLIAAGPEDIPFSFQSDFATSHAVGRLGFDRSDSYLRCARSLVSLERAASPVVRHAAFFGVEHRDDPLTWGSVEHLGQRLEQSTARAFRDWSVSSVHRYAATKGALRQLLLGPAPASLLFTAGHGLCYSADSPRQATHQGALLCADFPGPVAWSGSIPDEHMFASSDLPEQADLGGRVVLSFACFSAGTPRIGAYKGETLTERPFLAPLARGLLRRGALGVIGHVDVTLEQSFYWHQVGPQTSAFESLLESILTGCRLGHAMTFMADRYAQLAVDVAAATRRMLRTDSPDREIRELCAWAHYADARNFVLLGDPAARLNL